MSTPPLVSIIISVYNEEKYIAAAVKSILQQTYSHFELIIINDGSSDKTAEIIQSFSDQRICLINHTDKKNQAVRANEGIAIARGKYVARLDGDDISLPERLEKQVKYLENNAEISIVGSQYKIIDENGHFLYQAKPLPEKSDYLSLYTLFFCPFIHSSVMFRKCITENIRYKEDYYVTQDYDFFTQILTQYKGVNLKETLTLYREHTQNSHTKKRPEVIRFVSQIVVAFAKYLKIYFTEEDLKYILLFSESNPVVLSKKELIKLELWLRQFFQNSKIREVFTKKNINKLQIAIWREIAWKISPNDIFIFGVLTIKNLGIQYESIRLLLQTFKRQLNL